MRPRAFESPEQLEGLIDSYFDMCDATTLAVSPNGKSIMKPYTIIGLCNYLGICRDTLSEYSKLDGYSDTIKRARARVEEYTEMMAATSQINPVFAMFSLKNNFKWKDKHDIEVIQVESERSIPDLITDTEAKMLELKKLIDSE